MVDLLELRVKGDGTLNSEQTCEFLGIKYDTLRKWMSAKPPKIKSVKVMGYLRGFEVKEVQRVKNLMRSRKGLKRGQGLLPRKSA